MRTIPSFKYEKEKQEKWQKKTDIITRKIAILFILTMMVFFFLKMLLPSSPN